MFLDISFAFPIILPCLLKETKALFNSMLVIRSFSLLVFQYKAKTLNPKWLEQFDLHMFYDQTSMLEVSVWDHDHAGKDDIMGR